MTVTSHNFTVLLGFWASRLTVGYNVSCCIFYRNDQTTFHLQTKSSQYPLSCLHVWSSRGPWTFHLDGHLDTFNPSLRSPSVLHTTYLLFIQTTWTPDSGITLYCLASRFGQCQIPKSTNLDPGQCHFQTNVHPFTSVNCKNRYLKHWWQLSKEKYQQRKR